MLCIYNLQISKVNIKINPFTIYNLHVFIYNLQIIHTCIFLIHLRLQIHFTYWASNDIYLGPGARATTILTNLQRGNVPTQNIRLNIFYFDKKKRYILESIKNYFCAYYVNLFYVPLGERDTITTLTLVSQNPLYKTETFN